MHFNLKNYDLRHDNIKTSVFRPITQIGLHEFYSRIESGEWHLIDWNDMLVEQKFEVSGLFLRRLNI